MAEMSSDEYAKAKQAIVDFIFSTNNTTGRLILILAIAGMIIDAWDFSAFSLVTFAFANEFHTTSTVLGLSVVAVNIGAAIGGISGGYLTDRVGRKRMFIINMILFVAMALLAAVSTNVPEFIAFRTVLGFALGADVATGFVYLFEFMGLNQRMHYTSAWAYIWAIMMLVALFFVFILVTLLGTSYVIWRVIMALGGIFALVILILRTRIPESALWLTYRGQFKDAKEVIRNTYGKELASVPDVNIAARSTVKLGDIVGIFRLGYNRFFAHSWSQSVLVGFTFWGFSFYTPLLLTSLGITSTIYGKLLYDFIIWFPALLAAIISPFIVRVIGLKNLTSVSSFMMAVMFILIVLYTQHLAPLSVVLPSASLINFLLFLGPMSFFTVMNPGVSSKYRGIANGWTYTINKSTAVIAGFFGASIIASIGLYGNTLFLFVLALVAGIISATIGVNSLKSDPTKVESESGKAVGIAKG